MTIAEIYLHISSVFFIHGTRYQVFTVFYTYAIQSSDNMGNDACHRYKGNSWSRKNDNIETSVGIATKYVTLHPLYMYDKGRCGLAETQELCPILL